MKSAVVLSAPVAYRARPRTPQHASYFLSYHALPPHSTKMGASSATPKDCTHQLLPGTPSPSTLEPGGACAFFY